MIRITVVVTGVAGTALAFFKNSILVLWVLAADLGYCVILPQLICVLFCPVSNVYGAGVGYFMGILLRLLSGEPLIGLPPVIHFLGGEITDGVYIQKAPIRSIAMLFTLLCILLFSYLLTKKQVKRLTLRKGTAEGFTKIISLQLSTIEPSEEASHTNKRVHISLVPTDL